MTVQKISRTKDLTNKNIYEEQNITEELVIPHDITDDSPKQDNRLAKNVVGCLLLAFLSHFVPLDDFFRDYFIALGIFITLVIITIVCLVYLIYRYYAKGTISWTCLIVLCIGILWIYKSITYEKYDNVGYMSN